MYLWLYLACMYVYVKRCIHTHAENSIDLTFYLTK